MRIVQCKNATASCFSHVEPKHFLVKTEDSPDDLGDNLDDNLDGHSDNASHAASLNRQGGQFFLSSQKYDFKIYLHPEEDLGLRQNCTI